MEPNPNTSIFDFKFDETSKEQLRGLAHWTLIIAIASVISIVLGLIRAFTMQKTVRFGNQDIETVKTSSNVATSIVSAVIGLLIAYLLYQFSVNTKKGIDNLSQADLNKGLGSLKSYFLTYGIILIIVIVVVFLVVLIAGFGGKM